MVVLIALQCTGFLIGRVKVLMRHTSLGRARCRRNDVLLSLASAICVSFRWNEVACQLVLLCLLALTYDKDQILQIVKALVILASMSVRFAHGVDVCGPFCHCT